MKVALLAEGVDRNNRHYCYLRSQLRVALLAEGVDRNPAVPLLGQLPTQVALLAEGVDRNVRCKQAHEQKRGSPSSRRAWIEITMSVSVRSGHKSPSSRRAWIEILGIQEQSQQEVSRPPRGGRG